MITMPTGATESHSEQTSCIPPNKTLLQRIGSHVALFLVCSSFLGLLGIASVHSLGVGYDDAAWRVSLFEPEADCCANMTFNQTVNLTTRYLDGSQNGSKIVFYDPQRCEERGHIEFIDGNPATQGHGIVINSSVSIMLYAYPGMNIFHRGTTVWEDGQSIALGTGNFGTPDVYFKYNYTTSTLAMVPSNIEDVEYFSWNDEEKLSGIGYEWYGDNVTFNDQGLCLSNGTSTTGGECSGITSSACTPVPFVFAEFHDNEAPSYGGYLTVSGGVNPNNNGTIVVTNGTITHWSVSSLNGDCDCTPQMPFTFDLEVSGVEYDTIIMNNARFNWTTSLDLNVSVGDYVRIDATRGSTASCSIGDDSCVDMFVKVWGVTRCTP